MKSVKLSIIAGITLVLAFVGIGAALDEGFSEDTQMYRAVIRIDNLTCGGCFSTINTGLSSLEGFGGMGANLFRKMIAVDFGAPLAEDQILEKLSEIGYPGILDRVDEVSFKESFAYRDSQLKQYRGGGSCCPVAGAVDPGYCQPGSGCGLPTEPSKSKTQL